MPLSSTEMAAAVSSLRNAPARRSVSHGLGRANSRRLLRFAAVVGAFLVWGDATAAPPPGADMNSPVARWIKTLRNAPRGTPGQAPQSCCDFSDCRPTAMRMVDGRLQAWIGKDEFGWSAPDDWQDVDGHAQSAISDGTPPDGRSWACWFGGLVQCWAGGFGG